MVMPLSSMLLEEEVTVLLVDLGNTALKWSVLGSEGEPNTVVHRGQGHFKKDLYAEWLALKPSRVVGCTVAAPALAFSATKFFNDHGIAWEWVRPQSIFKAGGICLENHYANPSQLGADRWHAALGAVCAAPGAPLLVVHTGTATTVDSIAMMGNGRYAFLGGRIAPGITLMQKGLFEGIPSLPVEMGKSTDFPVCTADAIATGLIDAQVGLIVRAKHVFERTAGSPVRVMLAGGAAGYLAPHLRQEVPNLLVHHNLVLRGLAARAASTTIDQGAAR